MKAGILFNSWFKRFRKSVIRFNSRFKQKRFDSESLHDSTQNRLQVWRPCLYLYSVDACTACLTLVLPVPLLCRLTCLVVTFYHCLRYCRLTCPAVAFYHCLRYCRLTYPAVAFYQLSAVLSPDLSRCCLLSLSAVLSPDLSRCCLLSAVCGIVA